MMEKRYIEMVRLLIKAAPAVLEEGPFALKGGTALNLFLNDLPRLSVNLDLVFIDRSIPRETALRTIAESLATTREKLSRLGIEAEVVPSKSGEECKLFIGHGSGFLKVEVNHVFRGTVRPVETREMVPFAREFFATGLETRTLAPADFCGGDAFVKQHIQLEKIVVRPGDGAVRLRFGSATARQPYHLGTTGSRGTCKWRGSAYRREMVGMPRRRRPTFAAQPPLSNNTSNSKRSSSARETALCA